MAEYSTEWLASVDGRPCRYVLSTAESAADLVPVALIDVMAIVSDDHVMLINDGGRCRVSTSAPEPGESCEQTVRRIVRDLLDGEVEKFGLVGYLLQAKDGDLTGTYRLGYWATVRPLTDRGLRGQRVHVSQFSERVGYGQRGDLIMDFTLKKYRRACLQAM